MVAVVAAFVVAVAVDAVVVVAKEADRAADAAVQP
jgi:hypothetical protein